MITLIVLAVVITALTARSLTSNLKSDGYGHRPPPRRIQDRSSVSWQIR